MIKRIVTAVILIAAIAISALFTYLNPGLVELDLGFAAFELSFGLAFVLALGCGWLLGILTMLSWVARIAAQRRRLRAELKHSAHGGLPVTDERG